MVEPLGNIYHPKAKEIRHIRPKAILASEKLKQRDTTTPLKIVTVNLPRDILKIMAETVLDKKTGLYASRSEAVRHYVIRGLQNDLELLNAMKGDFLSEDEFPEDGDYFIDKYGKTWEIKPNQRTEWKR